MDRAVRWAVDIVDRKTLLMPQDYCREKAPGHSGKLPSPKSFNMPSGNRAKKV